MWDIIKVESDTVRINITANTARQELISGQMLGEILFSGTGKNFSNAVKVFDLKGRMVNSTNTSKINSGYYIIHKQPLHELRR